MSSGTPIDVDDEITHTSQTANNDDALIVPEEDQRTNGPTGSGEANDAEIGPDLTTPWIVSDGWFITAPSARALSATNTATNSLLIRDEDAVMNEYSVPASAAIVEQSSGTNTATSYPRATRFTDSQTRSDIDMMQVLARSLQAQVNNPNSNTREVNASNAGSATIPHPSQPDSSSEVITSSSNESRHEDSGGHPRVNPLIANSQINGTSGSVSDNDFMRFVRSVESLSVNVRILLGQNGNSNNGRPNRNDGAHQNGIVHARELLDEDDEPEEAQIKIRRKRSVEENRVHDILRNLLVDYKLRISKRREQFHLKECVPKAEVDDFEAGTHDGPNLSDLRLDWTNSMTSQWNSAAIYLLADHVLDRIKSNYYPGLKHGGWMTTLWIFEELKDKLAISKEEYENEIDLNAHEIDVNAAEKRARHAAKKCLKKTRNRRNMRRKTLYDCRIKIIQENLGSHSSWETALRIMNVIGDGAMSDDETDDERSTRRRKVVRRVQKPWASVPLSNMLNTLDLYYSRFYWDGLQKPGPGPRDRLTTIVSESPRPTPKSLPGNCYSSLYLGSLSPYQKSMLRIKRDMFIPTLPLPPA